MSPFVQSHAQNFLIASSLFDYKMSCDPMENVYAEIGLLHAASCQRGITECDLKSCIYLKGLMGHVEQCDTSPQFSDTAVAINGNCEECIEYWEIVKLHAKKCRKEDCPIDKCHVLRPSSMRKKLMAKMSTASSSSTVQGSNASSVNSRGGSFMSDAPEFTAAVTGSPHGSRSAASFTLSKKLGSFIMQDIEHDLGSELPRVASISKGLKSTGSFVSVGQSGDKEVPVLLGDETFANTIAEDSFDTNMENPMYAEEETMATMPKSPRRFRWLFGGV